MALRDRLTKQFANPSGITGYFVGQLMSLSNRSLCEWMVEKIDPRFSDRLLEIGYGTGRLIDRMASRLVTGTVIGVDHSKLMYEMARKRNIRYCKMNKAILYHAGFEHLQYPSFYFDSIYGVNVHIFWDDPVASFSKLRHFLKDDGRMVMVFRPKRVNSREDLVRVAGETSAQFISAGLRNVSVEIREMKPGNAIAITGTR